MSQSPQTTATTRPDMDIHEDVMALITRYPPLSADRKHIHVVVTDGIIRLTGYVRTPINRHYLLDRLTLIRGVIGIDADRLYDDSSLRIAIGRVLPQGVYANTRFGTAILAGEPPQGVDRDALIAAVRAIPGVQTVVTQF